MKVENEGGPRGIIGLLSSFSSLLETVRVSSFHPCTGKYVLFPLEGKKRLILHPFHRWKFFTTRPRLPRLGYLSERLSSLLVSYERWGRERSVHGNGNVSTRVRKLHLSFSIRSIMVIWFVDLFHELSRCYDFDPCRWRGGKYRGRELE